MKSITDNPPTSLSLNCLAISLAASRLVLSAVSSISDPPVAFAELISIQTKASVWSILIYPPFCKVTSL